MPVEKMKADPRVAAKRWPCLAHAWPVYCFEGVDNECPAKSFLLTANDTIKPEFASDLMGGMMAQGTVSLVRKENGETTTTPTRFTAIPFFANANRAPTNMEVDSSTKRRKLPADLRRIGSAVRIALLRE